jgi:hypothetical protein
MEWLMGGLATVGVAVAGWIGSLQGRLTKVEAQQVALKERLDGVEERIVRALDRIEARLDQRTDHR